MNKRLVRCDGKIIVFILLMLGLLFPLTDIKAQIVTNGSFENAEIGDVTLTGVNGWSIQIASGANAIFAITDSTSQRGAKSMKVTINGAGTNQWDIQLIADSLPAVNSQTYNFSIWAKAEKAGAQVNFTAGNYAYQEYGAIRPATLTTDWRNYTMQFTVNDNQSFVRAPIHFSYPGNVGNVIYIDNMLIYKGVDSSKFWDGPPLAEGAAKFLGNVPGTNDKVFAKYWNQITPGNEGKWGSVASSLDTTKWNWSGLDKIYNYAKSNNLIFKDHTLIWGQQQPSWISGLDSAQQLKYIETWIRMVGQRYPGIDMIDVVNEALIGHNPPDGGGGRANYVKALGGRGTTGWDWVINAFALARKYLPDAKLLINDYGIINDNGSTTSYLKIINLLKDRGLIDGIGVQGHRFEFESTPVGTLSYNLDRLYTTGLPIYISEMDLGNIGDTGTPNDNTQLVLYKKIFPVIWGHPGVKGVTLWGYLEGQMWQPTCYLVHTDGSPRPAFDWLVQYIKDNSTAVEETANNLPEEFKLEQNYPNPFNPSTKINYSIPRNSDVSLRVYNLLGQQIATLVEETQTAGTYSVVFDGSKLSSGIYFYQLQADDFKEIKKLILLK